MDTLLILSGPTGAGKRTVAENLGGIYRPFTTRANAGAKFYRELTFYDFSQQEYSASGCEYGHMVGVVGDNELRESRVVIVPPDVATQLAQYCWHRGWRHRVVFLTADRATRIARMEAQGMSSADIGTILMEDDVVFGSMQESSSYVISNDGTVEELMQSIEEVLA